jgi:hypothetical protein
LSNEINISENPPLMIHVEAAIGEAEAGNIEQAGN